MPKKKTKKLNPLVVSFDGGIESTAMILGYAEESIIPDAIVYEAGAAGPDTFCHVTETIPWLLGLLKFPALITVDDPDRWIATEFSDHIVSGGVVDRAVAVVRPSYEDPRWNWIFPLRDWKWDRKDCVDKIEEWSLPEVSEVSPAEVEVFSDPILEVISIHKGDKDWHGGAGWYYTLTDYPDEGSFGPFKKVADLLEAAEQELEIPGATPDVSSVEVDGKEQWVYGRPERDGWVTGGEISREGLAGYVHIVRAPDDPERMSRSERQKIHGNEKAAQKWKADLKPSSKGAWGEKITELLSDGQRRTFNRICLELSEFEYTADVAMGKAPDHALWDLVGEGKVEHTLVSPVLFRKVE